MKNRKIDRRTVYTINTIKDAFLKLTQEYSFNKITITQICREAEITRSTFYIHYDSISDLLNEILDDALLSSQMDTIENYTTNTHYLVGNESLLPACQRIGSSVKYRQLLMDPDLSEYIIGRIMNHERDNFIPAIIKKTGLPKQDAETIFAYVIRGSFAINKAHNFEKNAAWYHDVQLLNSFTEAGYSSLKNKQ